MLHLLDVEQKGYYTFYCTIRDIFGRVHSLKSHIGRAVSRCTSPNMFPYCTVKRLITYNNFTAWYHSKSRSYAN